MHFVHKKIRWSMSFIGWRVLAVRTRLELVTSCVTGRHSNLLN